MQGIAALPQAVGVQAPLGAHRRISTPITLQCIQSQTKCVSGALGIEGRGFKCSLIDANTRDHRANHRKRLGFKISSIVQDKMQLA